MRPGLKNLVAPGHTAIITQECQGAVVGPDAGLAALVEECDLPAERLAESRGPDTQARYDAHTQAAMDAGVFGAPTYVIDGELFWGQDRLDFVARKLGIV